MSNGKIKGTSHQTKCQWCQINGIAACNDSMQEKDSVKLTLVNGDEITNQDAASFENRHLTLNSARSVEGESCPKSPMAGKVIEIVPISTNDTMALGSTIPVLNGEHLKFNGNSANYGTNFVPDANSFMALVGITHVRGIQWKTSLPRFAVRAKQ